MERGGKDGESPGLHCVIRKKDFKAKRLTGNRSSDVRDDLGRSR